MKPSNLQVQLFKLNRIYELHDMDRVYQESWIAL